MANMKFIAAVRGMNGLAFLGLAASCMVSTTLDDSAFQGADPAAGATAGAAPAVGEPARGAGGAGGADDDNLTACSRAKGEPIPCGGAGSSSSAPEPLSAGSSTGGRAEAGGGAAGGTTDAEPDPFGAGLVLHYTFDTGSGTIVQDELSEANNGVVHGPAQWTAGRIGGALTLGGSDSSSPDPQYVELPPWSFTSFTETTVVTWVRWERHSRWQRIFDFGIDNGHSFFMTPDADDVALVVIRPVVEGVTQVHLQVKPILPQGEWTHVAVTWSASALVAYVDGRLAATTPNGPYAPAPGKGPVSLGAAVKSFLGRPQQPTTTDNYFAGSLDDFRVYNRALTQAEIVALRDSAG